MRAAQEGFGLEAPEMLEAVDEFGDGIGLQILSVFPGFVLQQTRNSLAVRQLVPQGLERTELVWTCFGFATDDEEMTERRLRQANLIGPAGYISMEDGAATGFVQRAVDTAADVLSVVEMGGAASPRTTIASPRPRCAASGRPIVSRWGSENSVRSWGRRGPRAHSWPVPAPARNPACGLSGARMLDYARKYGISKNCGFSVALTKLRAGFQIMNIELSSRFRTSRSLCPGDRRRPARSMAGFLHRERPLSRHYGGECRAGAAARPDLRHLARDAARPRALAARGQCLRSAALPPRDRRCR